LRIMPKVGPFKTLDFKIPTPETERLFMQSFDITLNRYRELATEIRAGSLTISNKDLDTGQPSRAGEYALADNTYVRLLEKLQEKHFADVDSVLRKNILGFYNGPENWKEPHKAKDRAKFVQTLKEFRDLVPPSQIGPDH